MRKTRHAMARMAKRGISSAMIKYVIDNGISVQDKIVLGRKEALQKLEILQEEARLLKKILDKGGVVVVADETAVITTYNYQGHKH